MRGREPSYPSMMQRHEAEDLLQRIEDGIAGCETKHYEKVQKQLRRKKERKKETHLFNQQT